MKHIIILVVLLYGSFCMAQNQNKTNENNTEQKTAVKVIAVVAGVTEIGSITLDKLQQYPYIFAVNYNEFKRTDPQDLLYQLEKFEIVSFTISWVKDGKVVEKNVKGNTLSQEILEEIKCLKKGSKIFIENITSLGNKGTTKVLSSVILKIE